MGYCTYVVRASDGVAVATWIGTGTDQGKTKSVTYNYSGCPNSKPGQASFQRCKDARCADARKQFCKDNGVMCRSLGYKICVGEICPCNKSCPSGQVLDRANCICSPKVTTGNCQGNCWSGTTGVSQIVKVCGSSCADARNKFCAQYGKPCPGGKKCYGANGADPCPGQGTVECDGWDPSTWGECMKSWCHAFDFIPGGGCQQYVQLGLLLGGIAVVVMILKR